MVARKKRGTKKSVSSKTSKKRISRKKPSQNSMAAHKRATEKMLFVAFISVLVVAFVVWFSQDFPAEGQAYRMQLELDSKQSQAFAVVSSCQTRNSCQYTLSVVETLGDQKITLKGAKVDPFLLTYYKWDGNLVEGIHKNFQEDLVSTVSYMGKRYPLTELKIS